MTGHWTTHTLAGPLTHPLPYRLFVFDADQTLRGCTVPDRPPNTLAESVLLPNVVETLARYTWAKDQCRAGICSNQGGVALGYISYSYCRALLDELLREATGVPWARNAVRLCPHAPDAGCLCRKPQPAMLLGVIAYYQDLGQLDHFSQALFVGDQESDQQTAAAAGVAFAWARDFFGWESTEQ